MADSIISLFFLEYLTALFSRLIKISLNDCLSEINISFSSIIFLIVKVFSSINEFILSIIKSISFFNLIFSYLRKTWPTSIFSSSNKSSIISANLSEFELIDSKNLFAILGSLMAPF